MTITGELFNPPVQVFFDGVPALEAPLLDLTDRQVMELGMQLDVPWALAWSCDLEGPAPCRVCAGCRRRQEHFAAVRLRDPAAETLRRPA